MIIYIMSFLAFLLGIILGIYLPYYNGRRMWRSQFGNQKWYWFITSNMREIGYPKWRTFNFMRHHNYF